TARDERCGGHTRARAAGRLVERSAAELERSRRHGVVGMAGLDRSGEAAVDLDVQKYLCVKELARMRDPIHQARADLSGRRRLTRIRDRAGLLDPCPHERVKLGSPKLAQPHAAHPRVSSHGNAKTVRRGTMSAPTRRPGIAI